MKKFLIFILTLILLSLITLTSCLFYGPCKTKIKEIVPEKYHSYIDKFNFQKNEKELAKETLNIGEDQENNLENTQTNTNEEIEAKKELEKIEKKLENNEEILENNNKDKTEKLAEDKKETENIGENQENNLKNQENIGENTKNISEKEKENINKNSEEKIENQEKEISEENSTQENEIAKKKREEYRQKLLARLNKDKPKEKELVKEKTIKITKDGKEVEVKIAKFLGNGFYFTQDKEKTYLYLNDKLLYTIKNSTDFFDKETVNENPDLLTDGPVIRAEILKSFSLKKLGENVFLLTQKKWEENKLYLIDAKNNKIIPLKKDFSHDIKKAELAKKGVVFLVDKKYYEAGVYYINRNTKIVLNIFKNSAGDISKDSFDYKKAEDFKIVENSAGESIVEIKISGPKGVELIKHIEF